MTDRTLHFPLPDEYEDAELRARVAAAYQAVPTADPAQVERCARAVLAAAMHAPAERRTGVVSPRWWWGVAAAAVLVVMTSRPWRPELARNEADSAFTASRPITEPRGATVEERGDVTRFDLVLPTEAEEVALVGDFNGWDENATPMVRRAGNTTWSARVPLPPGRHIYAFVVDGRRWLVDPLAPQVPDAGYGPTNALIVDGTN